MSNDCENLYKICRVSAGLTQEQAAELLAIAPRTLSDYERDQARVPDDTVARMAEAYNAPLIAYYHLRRFSPLGKYLPDLQEPQTHGDMAFQAIIARDELGPAVDCIKRLVADGAIDSDEQRQFSECITALWRVYGKILLVVAYVERIGEKSKEPCK